MFLLDKALGFPSQAFSSIHVAGTNGKGSVSTKIARSLQAAGKKVGLYTSPHLSSFCERIEINRLFISEKKAEQLLEKIFTLADSLAIRPTFFETLTLLAFLYFAEEQVDYAALEVGMGGRLDATNIVTPILSVITSIDFDHTQYLGSTLEAIAFEKAGIIKSSVPIVLGPKVKPLSIFEQVSKERQAPLHVLSQTFSHYEEENRAIASFALQRLPIPIAAKAIEETPSCRFELFEREIPIILDVGHNPAAFRALFSRVQEKYPKKPIHALVAISSDKEISATLKELLKFTKKVTFSEADHPRALKMEELKKALEEAHQTIHFEPNLMEAFSFARHRAFQDKAILVACGTFFMMDPLLSTLKEGKEPACD